jgi:hypothetical protein
MCNWIIIIIIIQMTYAYLATFIRITQQEDI